jgi:hypothetical protein
MRSLKITLAAALFLYGAGCKPKVETSDAANTPIAGAGPETWIIEGKPVRIESTYYLDLPYGLQYTVHYPWAFGQNKVNMTEQEALAIALPLMEYAYGAATYRRATIRKNGVPVEASRIGLVLIEHQASGDRGYKVSQSLAEIRARMAAEGRSPAAR